MKILRDYIGWEDSLFAPGFRAKQNLDPLCEGFRQLPCWAWALLSPAQGATTFRIDLHSRPHPFVDLREMLGPHHVAIKLTQQKNLDTAPVLHSFRWLDGPRPWPMTN